MCADVVIVGGGPIGCWTAIQAKKRNPALEIQIYERHPDYQRDHMMSIRKTSLTRYSKRTNDALEQEMYRDIAAANSSADMVDDVTQLRKVNHIKTLSLENILKQYCAKLGIGIEYRDISAPEDVMVLHPECKSFIAADGARSKMRNALLGEDSVVKQDVFSSIDVKYQAHGQAKYLSEPTYDKMDSIVVETVGKEKARQTSVALRFLVDEQTFDKLPEATFKKPLTKEDLPSHRPNMFGYKLNEFQKIRKDYTGETVVEGSEKITKVKLSQYASKKFAVTVKDEQDKNKAGWFFVGDAAMGMPFYRSINSGLLLGSQLGAIVSNTSLSVAAKTKIYNAVRPMKVAREFGAVSAKLSGIKAYQKAVRPVLRGAARAGLAVAIVPIIGAVYVVSKVCPNARLM